LHKKIIFHHEGKIILQGAFLPKKNQNTKKVLHSTRLSLRIAHAAMDNFYSLETVIPQPAKPFKLVITTKHSITSNFSLKNFLKRIKLTEQNKTTEVKNEKTTDRYQPDIIEHIKCQCRHCQKGRHQAG
jgi:hypothetical protein